MTAPAQMDVISIVRNQTMVVQDSGSTSNYMNLRTDSLNPVLLEQSLTLTLVCVTTREKSPAQQVVQAALAVSNILYNYLSRIDNYNT